ncbi:hypothetical protein K431DRAFT_283679 [Polychaeton citri CBS 116435]|uniref:Uncharacterized protein n=1 Tax=Polychaeton citri CBS 116435 TaxID=1314669 RepID=A0A9P4QDJ7_9PEZI|nr:hypothetical protein K431DRAFT_283679 [Polychaeton citri CBS 116435]
MYHIVKFIDDNDILQYIFCPAKQRQCQRKIRSGHQNGGMSNVTKTTPVNPLLYTIQVLMTPALLSLDDSHFLFRNTLWSFPRSQQMAYSSAAEWPIFGGASGLDVNMEWVLHNVNFWRHHTTRRHEATLHHAFSELSVDEMPQFWDERLAQIDKHADPSKRIGRLWKGSYAYIDRSEVRKMRAGLNTQSPILDHLNAEEGDDDVFQEVKLEIVDDDDSGQVTLPWLDLFESHLGSITPPPSRVRTRAQHRSSSTGTNTEGDNIIEPAVGFDRHISTRFEGTGYHEYEDFQAAGWLNPLPLQHGIPGWQRMTMMKYFVDHGTLDTGALWAYEGVALPGGKIIVGRWWSPSEAGTAYSGPFILWCIDGSARAEEERLQGLEEQALGEGAQGVGSQE